MPQVIPNAAMTQIPGMPPIHIQNQGLDGQVHPSAIPPHMDPMGYASPNYIGNQSPQDDRDRRGERDFDFRRGVQDRRRDGSEDRHHIRDKFEGDRRGGRRNDYDKKTDEDYRKDRERDRFVDQKQRDNEMQGGLCANSEVIIQQTLILFGLYIFTIDIPSYLLLPF